jgi:hypothetical protein
MLFMLLLEMMGWLFVTLLRNVWRQVFLYLVFLRGLFLVLKIPVIVTSSGDVPLTLYAASLFL